MLSERLKQAREFTGKGQKEMSRLAGVSYRVWQSYEAGKVTPGGKVFESLSNMGFNTNWLLTGEGEMRIDADGKQKKDSDKNTETVVISRSTYMVMQDVLHELKRKYDNLNTGHFDVLLSLEHIFNNPANKGKFSPEIIKSLVMIIAAYGEMIDETGLEIDDFDLMRLTSWGIKAHKIRKDLCDPNEYDGLVLDVLMEFSDQKA